MGYDPKFIMDLMRSGSHHVNDEHLKKFLELYSYAITPSEEKWELL